MQLWQGYRKSTSWSRLLLSEREFARAVKIERLRADRRQLPFCMLQIVLREIESPKKAIRKAARVLKDRLRLTDIIGQLGPNKLGAILTDTAGDGGQIVTLSLYKLLAEAGFQVEILLDVYSPWIDHSRTVQDRDGNDSDSDSAARKEDEESVAALPIASHFELRRRVDVTVAKMSAEPATIRSATKRAVDIVGSAVLLILFAPLMAIIALAIKFTSPGPVIFRQRREGRGGEPFTILKFRSMVDGAHRMQDLLRQHSHRDGPAFKIKEDPRTTPIGRLLRATCMDELPQLWNVMRGDMSLVGPRPLPWTESRECEVWHRRRLDIRPGLTGDWQVGKRDECFDDWMRSDLRYAEDYSILGTLNC